LPLDLAVSPPAAIQAEMAVQAEGGDSRPSSAQEPSPAVPPSLLAHERELLNRTLQACDGNISETARRLGISRGRIYRHLAQVQDAGPVKGHPGR
jgi:transcriptional regulator of acetoin/glycerol metabolism